MIVILGYTFRKSFCGRNDSFVNFQNEKEFSRILVSVQVRQLITNHTYLL